jgi:hypothetical protein
MKLSRMFLALVVLASLASVAYVGQRAEPAAARMAVAAERFLDSLTPEQRKAATFAFDDKERTNWEFVPLQDKDKNPGRKGLRLKDMTDAQKKLALDLVAAGTSANGNKQATTIMGLESILKVQEAKGAIVRDPEWYFFTIFGTPGKTGPWGWRVEGHHLSINYTLKGGEVVSATPTFFGANPSTVKDGPKKGEQILPEVENLARQLYKSLTDDQRKVALQEKQFGEPKSKTVNSGVGAAQGIEASKLTSQQREMLAKLVRAYADRHPEEVSQAEYKAIEGAGMDKIHFAYAGSTDPGQQYSYRVQGPSFVIEFLNVQADSAKNPANHIHSALRNIEGDFGVSASK